MRNKILRLLAIAGFALTGTSAALAQQLVSVYGTAPVAGRDAVVHIWVILPPGADANQIALEALRSQGARPFLPGEFSATGLVWEQFFDSNWLPLSGCCTLGVTWYGTSIDEAGMALNTKFPRGTNGQDYDVETVYLHENGHVAGLGHWDIEEAVM